MKRIFSMLFAMSLVAIGPNAGATAKSGTCPEGFTTQDQKAFVRARNDAGAPDRAEGPAIFSSIDVNQNGIICVRPLRDNPGTPAWYVVASDDKVPPRK